MSSPSQQESERRRREKDRREKNRKGRECGVGKR